MLFGAYREGDGRILDYFSDPHKPINKVYAQNFGVEVDVKAEKVAMELYGLAEPPVRPAKGFIVKALNFMFEFGARVHKLAHQPKRRFPTTKLHRRLRQRVFMQTTFSIMIFCGSVGLLTWHLVLDNDISGTYWPLLFVACVQFVAVPYNVWIIFMMDWNKLWHSLGLIIAFGFIENAAVSSLATYLQIIIEREAFLEYILAGSVFLWILSFAYLFLLWLQLLHHMTKIARRTVKLQKIYLHDHRDPRLTNIPVTQKQPIPHFRAPAFLSDPDSKWSIELIPLLINIGNIGLAPMLDEERRKNSMLLAATLSLTSLAGTLCASLAMFSQLSNVRTFNWATGHNQQWNTTLYVGLHASMACHNETGVYSKLRGVSGNVTCEPVLFNAPSCYRILSKYTPSVLADDCFACNAGSQSALSFLTFSSFLLMGLCLLSVQRATKEGDMNIHKVLAMLGGVMGSFLSGCAVALFEMVCFEALNDSVAFGHPLVKFERGSLFQLIVATTCMNCFITYLHITVPTPAPETRPPSKKKEKLEDSASKNDNNKNGNGNGTNGGDSSDKSGKKEKKKSNKSKKAETENGGASSVVVNIPASSSSGTKSKKQKTRLWV
eukprot:c1505_g2_i1.p1 GENE.c1505_g2_i1~~c1505_g2_i1.p1  ORF type:complete len:606 (+),score=124.44 c1505_g2_i1:49-1866(+)